jgi:hypothetical protein
MTEPALFSLDNQRGSRPLDVVSWGAGVESSAYLTEILTNPTRHDVDPQNLVVLHAVVGSEFTDTLTLSQRFILPLLADRGVRHGRWRSTTRPTASLHSCRIGDARCSSRVSCWTGSSSQSSPAARTSM